MVTKNSVIVIVISILALNVFSVSGESVKQWDVFELELTGPSTGNPFLDVTLTASFTHWVLQFRIVKTGLNGIHKLYTIKIQFVCHYLLGKYGITLGQEKCCIEQKDLVLCSTENIALRLN